MPTPAAPPPRHRRLLAEMGIDVWIRRAALDPDATAPVTTQPTLTVLIDALPRPAELDASPDRHIVPMSAAAETVELECMAAPGAVVMGAFASALDRRFAQDVVLAVAGATAKVVRTQFRWPQTQTAARTPSAARSAFAGFLRGQTERTDARCVMLLGNAATALLEPAFALAGCKVLSLPDAAQLRGDAAQKKTLWLTISHLAQH